MAKGQMHQPSALRGVAAGARLPGVEASAARLARALSLPLLTRIPADSGYLLIALEQRIEIRSATRPPQHGPVLVDFVGGQAAHRRAFGGGRRQALARAVGLGGGNPPRIIDATAGLGKDAFVLASLGAEVWLIEQSPAIAALLQDGLRRALASPLTHEIARRMHLSVGAADQLLPQIAAHQKPDAIYLDPMYPPRQKSAAVKKEMRLLQALAAGPGDASALLACARHHAGRRVVVKRPAGAPPLADRKPHATIRSPKTRYDIYGHSAASVREWHP